MAKRKRTTTPTASPGAPIPSARADAPSPTAGPGAPSPAAGAVATGGPTRPPQTAPRRGTDRLGRLRRARRRGPSLPWIVGLGGLALIVAIQIGVNVYRDLRLPGERFASQGNVHVSLGAATPPYNSNPPTSGWHTPELAPWGSHLESVADQRLVHNMEDGGVVLWYREGSQETNRAHVEALEGVVAGRYGRVVIAPRADMPTTYALTAWQRLERFEEVDEVAMRAFIAAYHGVDHHPR